MKTAGTWLMAVAVPLLLAGWAFPALWRPAFAALRPPGFLLLGLGALAMWRHASREADQRRAESLAALTHSSLTPYEFAPVTLPMEEEPEAAGSPDSGKVAGTAPVGSPAAQARSSEATSARPAPRGNPTDAQFEAVAASTAESTAESAAEGVNLAPSTPTPTTAPTSVSISLPEPVLNAAMLRSLEWRRFEALCEEMFKQDGYVTKSPRHDSGVDVVGDLDGGADIWLHSRLDLHQPVRIVQCRNWSSEPIGVSAIREFLGAMVDAGIKSGAFMTCATFTPEAEVFARRHGITLVNGAEMMMLIDKRDPPLQRELLAVATQGDYQRPTCRRCGLKMVASTAAAPLPDGASTHWVCEGAPRCPGTLDWSPGAA
jgi:hypothetical protein